MFNYIEMGGRAGIQPCCWLQQFQHFHQREDYRIGRKTLFRDLVNPGKTGLNEPGLMDKEVFRQQAEDKDRRAYFNWRPARLIIPGSTGVLIFGSKTV